MHQYLGDGNPKEITIYLQGADTMKKNGTLGYCPQKGSSSYKQLKMTTTVYTEYCSELFKTHHHTVIRLDSPLHDT